MVPVTTNIEEMLKSFSATMPVNTLSQPTVFQELIPAVLPVLTFDPAPLVSPLLRVEMFRQDITLGGGDNNVNFNTLAVPPLEIHRYYTLGIGNGDVPARVFLLKELYADSAGVTIAQTLMARVNINPGIAIPTNMLATLFDSGTKPLNFHGVPFDLYPGGFWQINNESALGGGSSYFCMGVRLIYRGPAAPAPVNVTDDIFTSSS